MNICRGLSLSAMFSLCLQYYLRASNVCGGSWKSLCVLHGRIICRANIQRTGLLIVSVEMLVVLRTYWKAVRKEGSAGMFFLKGHSAGKGTASIRIEAKGPCVILLGHCNLCCLHPHSFSVTLTFSLLIIVVTPSLISVPHYLIPVTYETHCGCTELIWNWSVML